MAADDFQTQEALTRQITQNLSQINVALTDQLRIQALLANAARGSATTAAQTGQITEQALAAAGVQMTSLNNATAGLAGTSAAAGGMIRNVGENMSTVGAGIVGVAGNIGDAFDNTALTIHNLARGPLHNSLAQLQKSFGGLMSEGGLAAPGNELVARFKEINVEVNRELYNTRAMYAIQGAPLKYVLGDLNSAMEAYNAIGKQSINMFALMQDGSADLAIQMGLLGKGLGLTAEQTGTFVQRQISLTGTAGTDMLKEAASAAKAMEAATGISAKMIGKSIAGMIADTKNFGNVTSEEAARMSATLFELGLDYGDLGNMVGQFQSFDAAAQSVSALTTVFGVQIDSMEMMRLANEDQETFLHRMREAFLEAGRSADTLSLAEKRLIQEQLGLKDVESVERLLDPTAAISSMEELASATAAAPDEMTEVLKSLGGDIVNFGKVTDFTMEKTRTFIEDGARAPLEETAIAAEQASVKIGRAFAGSLGRNEATALQGLSQSMQEIAGMDPVKLAEINERLAETAHSVASITGGIDADSFRESMTEISSILGELDVGGSITEGISGAVTSIEEAFTQMAANIEATLQRHGIIRDDSPHTNIETAMSQSAAAVITQGAVMVGAAAATAISMQEIAATQAEEAEVAYSRSAESINDSFATAFDSMTAEGTAAFGKLTTISDSALTTQLGDATSVYSGMARELGFLGMTYDQLSDEQITALRTQLKLGEDYEDQIKTILGSEEASRGSREKSQGTFMTAMMETYSSLSEEQQTAMMGNDDFMKSLNDKYNIDATAFSSIMSGDASDIEGSVRAAQRSQTERRTAETATEATSEEASRAEAAETVSRESRAQTQSLSDISEKLATNTREVRKVVTALDTLSEKIPQQQTVILKVGERQIADAVINSPGGSEESEGTVLIQRA